MGSFLPHLAVELRKESVRTTDDVRSHLLPPRLTDLVGRESAGDVLKDESHDPSGNPGEFGLELPTCSCLDSITEFPSHPDPPIGSGFVHDSGV